MHHPQASCSLVIQVLRWCGPWEPQPFACRRDHAASLQFCEHTITALYRKRSAGVDCCAKLCRTIQMRLASALQVEIAGIISPSTSGSRLNRAPNFSVRC